MSSLRSDSMGTESGYGRTFSGNPTEIDGSKVAKRFKILRHQREHDGYGYLTEDNRIFTTDCEAEVIKIDEKEMMGYANEAQRALEDYEEALKALKKGESK